MSEPAVPPDHTTDAPAIETLLADVPLEVTVELGRARLVLGELAARARP